MLPRTKNRGTTHQTTSRPIGGITWGYTSAPATSLKIVIALRYDLLMHVFNATRDAGFQKKNMTLYRDIKWSKDQLIELLDKRINLLIRGAYTGAAVSHAGILDVKMRTKQKSAIDYMLDRTFMRPRDIIQFFNICIARATNEPVITTKILYDAEAEYSDDRLRSLFDEWRNDYPNLRDFIELLRGRTSAFNIGQLDDATCNEFAINFVAHHVGRGDALSEAASNLLEDNDPHRFRRTVVAIFFLTGLISVKADTGLRRSYLGFTTLDPTEIDEQARLHVHPMFWCALGINEARKALAV